MAKGKEWTDFIQVRLGKRNNQLFVHPSRLESTLLSLALKEALINIPEDREEIPAGEIVEIQLLSPNSLITLPNQ